MKISKYIAGCCFGAFALLASSCVGDLDQKPTDPNIQTKPESKEDIMGYFAAVYYDFYTDQGLKLSDGGRGVFTRCHNDLNEITSDELFISEKWQDPGYQVLNKNIWTDTNEWIFAAFSRENHTAKIASTFIAALAQYGAEFGYTDAEIKAMDAEARFLRAYAYYQNIDLFGKGPWIDETSVTGATPATYDRKELFEATVADLTAYVDNLIPAAQQEAGRVPREAGYMLLAKLYLNAEVYIGQPMYAECASILANHVVNTGLTLAPTYKYLFCAGNKKYLNQEILFGFPQEIGYLESWGGTTEMTCAAYMEPDDEDTELAAELRRLNFHGSPWSGLRMRPELSKALLQETERQLMYIGSYQIEIPDLANYNEKSCGYMLTKYSNAWEDDYDNTVLCNEYDAAYAYNKALEADKEIKDEDKVYKEYPAFNNSSQQTNITLPIFRLADAYLMLAECQLRGVECNGISYFNKVRERAKRPTVSSLSASELLNERMVELYAEGFRRSDLIRFNRYAGNAYLWSWKGGEFTGTSIPETREVFPIPYQYVLTVPQNPGY